LDKIFGGPLYDDFDTSKVISHHATRTNEDRHHTLTRIFSRFWSHFFWSGFLSGLAGSVEISRGRLIVQGKALKLYIWNPRDVQNNLVSQESWRSSTAPAAVCVWSSNL